MFWWSERSAHQDARNSASAPSPADGPPYYNRTSLQALGLAPDDVAERCAAERAEAHRQAHYYHGGSQRIPRRDRDVLVIDDGRANGVTATAALRAVTEEQPRRTVFAAPVCFPDIVQRLRHEADDVVCLTTPTGFGAVAMWYHDFHHTTDERVALLLNAARGRTLDD